MLSFFIYFGEIGSPNGLPSLLFDPGVRVSSIPRSTAAANGILKQGDVVLEVNGMPLTQSVSPSPLEAQRGMNNLIAAIRATPDGGEIELSILRGNQDYAQTVRLQPQRAFSDKDLPGGGAQTIGVLLSPNVGQSKILKSENPLEAARLAFQYTSTLTADTAKGLLDVFTQIFVGTSRGGGGGNNGGGTPSVSGPIGLISTGSEVVATKDLSTVLKFMAAVSINLGVVNAFPLPVLDGGQLLFVLAEAITRKKIDQRIQETISSFAALLLLWFTVFATVGDLSSIFGR